MVPREVNLICSENRRKDTDTPRYQNRVFGCVKSGGTCNLHYHSKGRNVNGTLNTIFKEECDKIIIVEVRRFCRSIVHRRIKR
jgi:hypothetical protein